MNLKKHLIAVILAIMAFLFFYYVWKCPFKLVFGIPCAGCGMTRALMSVLKLEFDKAFTYHPLWLLVPPGILYLYFKNYFSLSQRNEIVAVVLLAILFTLVWLYRLMFCNIINYL